MYGILVDECTDFKNNELITIIMCYISSLSGEISERIVQFIMWLVPLPLLRVLITTHITQIY